MITILIYKLTFPFFNRYKIAFCVTTKSIFSYTYFFILFFIIAFNKSISSFLHSTCALSVFLIFIRTIWFIFQNIQKGWITVYYSTSFYYRTNTFFGSYSNKFIETGRISFEFALNYYRNHIFVFLALITKIFQFINVCYQWCFHLK